MIRPAATRRFLEALAALPIDHREAAKAALGQFLAEVEQRSVRAAGPDPRQFEIKTLTGDRLVLRLEPRAETARVVWLAIKPADR